MLLHHKLIIPSLYKSVCLRKGHFPFHLRQSFFLKLGHSFWKLHGGLVCQSDNSPLLRNLIILSFIYYRSWYRVFRSILTTASVLINTFIPVYSIYRRFDLLFWTVLPDVIPSLGRVVGIHIIYIVTIELLMFIWLYHNLWTIIYMLRSVKKSILSPHNPLKGLCLLFLVLKCTFWSHSLAVFSFI